MNDHFAASSDGISIHYLDNGGSDPSLVPLLIVPGMMGIADHHEPELSSLAPRRVVALTHRGLGKSGSVKVGQCSFEQRALDVDAVVKDLGLKEYILYGFSRGVPLAVQHASLSPSAVKALIIHDCDPVYMRGSERWYNHLVSLQKPYMPAATVEAYWKDSDEVNLCARLNDFTFPVLLIRGALNGSLMSADTAESLLSRLQKGQIKVLANSAHEVADIDRDAYLAAIKAFCDEVES